MAKRKPMTLTNDDHVPAATKAPGKRKGTAPRAAVSGLARRSLRRSVASRQRNGVPLLPVTNDKAVVTLEIVNALRDETPKRKLLRANAT
jgi:hypothetical protein